jgi:hypothetical protein
MDFVTIPPQDSEELSTSVLSNIPEQATSRNSNSTNAVDLLDIDMSPTDLLSSTTNLQSIVEATVSTLSFLKDMTPTSSITSLDTTFRDLYGKLYELERIIASYTSVPRGETDEMLNIDPALWQWLTDCMVCVLGIQASVESDLDWRSKKLGRENDATDLDFERLDLADVFDEHAEVESDGEEGWAIIEETGKKELDADGVKLADYVERLGVFLPILERYVMSDEHNAILTMSSDLAEYHTSGMAAASDVRMEHLPFLRAACYALKDQLGTLFEKTIQWSAYSESLKPSLRALREKVEKVQKQLSIYLTNNASEWLESLITGNLSFSEWRRLSIIEIRKLENGIRRSVATIDTNYRNGVSKLRAVDLNRISDIPRPSSYQNSNLEKDFRQSVERALPELERVVVRLSAMMKVTC